MNWGNVNQRCINRAGGKVSRQRKDFAQRRAAAGYTQESLADYLGIDRSTVTRWEIGRSAPLPWIRPKLARALGISIEELSSMLETVSGNAAEPVILAAPYVPQSRTALEKPAFILPSSVARTDPAMADSLLITLQQYAMMDNLAGPHQLLPVAIQQMSFVEQLLAGSRGRTYDRLLYVAARFAEFTGWLHQDTGDLRAAMQWSNTALDFAQEADDPQLVSYVWMRKSNIASDARKPGLAIAFARSALQNQDGVSSSVKAATLRQEAYSHAVSGDFDSCARAVDEAFRHVSDVPDDGDDIARYCTPNYVDMEVAHCWVELGKIDKAVEALNRGLEGWRPDFRRDLGLGLARMALAHVRTGQLDEAVAVAQDSLVIAAETRSYRIASQLARVPRLLTAIDAHDPAEYLGQAMRDILGTS
jgi:transcriptional regulator with XRE-family HTH domain